MKGTESVLNSNYKQISCDQVAWLLDMADRYLPQTRYPAVSQQRQMLKYAMLYEIMEIAGLQFKDGSARWNGTPNPARDYDNANLQASQEDE